MTAKHLLTLSIALAISFLTAAASLADCQTCRLVCDPNDRNNCIVVCTPCGTTTKSYKLTSMLKLREGDVCTVTDKTHNVTMNGKVKGQYCVLKHPLH
jgi:hypothetical protein